MQVNKVDRAESMTKPSYILLDQFLEIVWLVCPDKNFTIHDVRLEPIQTYTTYTVIHCDQGYSLIGKFKYLPTVQGLEAEKFDPQKTLQSLLFLLEGKVNCRKQLV